MDDPSSGILILALSATAVAKVLVDLLRMALELPRWVPPIAALIIGISAVALMELSASVPFTPALWATIILAGVLAGGQAVGVTTLQRQAEKVQDVRDASAIEKANKVIAQ